MNSDIATGKHYKNHIIKEHHVGQPLDPAMIALIRGDSMSPMRFTALKKILEPGERGRKTFEQDIEDAIGALKRELELLKVSEL